MFYCFYLRAQQMIDFEESEYQLRTKKVQKIMFEKKLDTKEKEILTV